MQFRYILIAVWSVFVFSTLTNAQGVTQTPFSQFGVGDIEQTGTARNFGMGSVGVSMPNRSYINIINPALLAFNRSNVIFEAGFYAQNVDIKNQSSAVQITNGNVHYFHILFPIGRKNWTIAAGLTPYSNANAKFYSSSYVESAAVRDSLRTLTQLEGGLSQVYISQGIKLPKNFTIGLSIAYVFGGINRKSIQTLIFPSNYQNTSTQILSKEAYRVFEFKPGISWFTPVTAKNNLYLGATGTFSVDASSKRTLQADIVKPSNYGYESIYSDTTSRGEGAQVSLPQQFRIGASVDKTNQWNVGFDYTMVSFKNYKGFEQNTSYLTGHKFALGGEIVPKYDALKGYLKKMVYRIGASYYLTPYQFNNQQVTDMNFSAGVGLPVGKGSTVSSLNISFTMGRRGAIAQTLIEENYIRFNVGISITDRWFVRYKLD